MLTKADYGAGLYKAGELDERMGHEAVVHREVEGHESSLFKNYFKPITYVAFQGRPQPAARHGWSDMGGQTWVVRHGWSDMGGQTWMVRQNPPQAAVENG